MSTFYKMLVQPPPEVAGCIKRSHFNLTNPLLIHTLFLWSFVFLPPCFTQSGVRKLSPRDHITYCSHSEIWHITVQSKMTEKAGEEALDLDRFRRFSKFTYVLLCTVVYLIGSILKECMECGFFARL